MPASIAAKMAMLQSARVINDTPNSVNHSALRYGDSGPNSDARSRYRTLPVVICHGTYSSRPKSTSGSGHFRQLHHARPTKTTAWRTAVRIAVRSRFANDNRVSRKTISSTLSRVSRRAVMAFTLRTQSRVAKHALSTHSTRIPDLPVAAHHLHGGRP